jgi:CheY-like chemotaxis protein
VEYSDGPTPPIFQNVRQRVMGSTSALRLSTDGNGRGQSVACRLRIEGSIGFSMNIIPGLILHVDDDESVRESMSMLLRAEDYGIVSAANETEALQLLSAGLYPDVLIVDFHLSPRTNGAEVAEQIRTTLNYALPVIILTGDVTNARFPRIVEALVWLAPKPLNPQLLLAVLPNLVQLSRTTRKLPSISAKETLLAHHA